MAVTRPDASPLDNASPGFSPEVRRAPELAVVAPLNVNAAASKAQGLADALGIAAKVATPILGKYAQEDIDKRKAEGQLAAQTGTEDAARAKQDAYYEQGMKRGAVEKFTLDTLSQWQQQYEGMDKSLGEDEVVRQFDDFVGKRLSGIAGDSDAAKWMLERLGPAEARLRQTHREQLAQQHRDDMVSTVGAMIRDDLANGKVPDAENAKHILIGSGFTRSDATAEYVGIVGTLAVETYNPRVLDALIPEKWSDGTPGPRSSPKLNNEINKYRAYAEEGYKAAARESKDRAKEQVDMGLLKVTQLAAQGDVAGSLKELDAMVARGDHIERTDYQSLTNFARSSRDDAREQQFSATKLADFRLGMLADPTQFTLGDAARFVANNFPRGKDGMVAANQFDDFQSAYKAAKAAEENPLAKAYRSYFTSAYSPDPGSTQAKKERFAGALLTFDKTFLQTHDAEQAKAAAEKVIDATKAADKVPTGNVTTDVKSLSEGTINAADFVRKHSNADSIAQIREAARKGEITTEQAKKAALLLQ
jgi:hypothetical protein